MDKQAFIEGAKELGRVILLGIVSFALTEGVINTILVKIGVFADPEIRLVIIGFLTSALRAVDKFLHETGKNKEAESVNKAGVVTEPSLLTGGLTRF
jgi:hypothetical protein